MLHNHHRLHDNNWPCTCLGDVAEIGSGSTGFNAAIPTDHPLRGLTRKWWEWEFIVTSAERCGCLMDQSVALGLGVGTELLPFYFATRCQQVIATDLYSATTAWQEARSDELDALRANPPIAHDPARLEFRACDMRNVPLDDASVDCIWSTSSIEHVPTLADAFATLREAARLLKPGGHAVLTTEWCLSEPPYLLGNLNAFDPAILAAIADRCSAFELVGHRDTTYNHLHPGNGTVARRFVNQVTAPREDYTVDPRYAAGQMTNMVGASLLCPVGLVLKRRPDGVVPELTDLGLPQEYVDYTQGRAALEEGDPAGAAELLAPLLDSDLAATSLQFRTHCLRYLIDAERQQADNGYRPGNRIEAAGRDRLLEQPCDGDVLDFLASVSECAGDHRGAAEFYAAAARSPSTLTEHAIDLALAHLVARDRQGEFGHGVGLVMEVVEDLWRHGIACPRFDDLWRRRLGWLPVGRAKRLKLAWARARAARRHIRTARRLARNHPCT